MASAEKPSFLPAQAARRVPIQRIDQQLCQSNALGDRVSGARQFPAYDALYAYCPPQGEARALTIV
jgi:hypothetical protein